MNPKPTFRNLGRLGETTARALLPPSSVGGLGCFPQSKALGLGVDEDLSPAVLRKCVHLATKLPSFGSAQQSIAETIEVELTTKRVERLTERIGGARVSEREVGILLELEASPGKDGQTDTRDPSHRRRPRR